MPWIHPDTRNIVPEQPRSAATAIEQPLSWRAAWLALREVLRPYPDAFAATAELVKRLLDECDQFGDPGARKEPDPEAA